jgi:hypothetical protein
MNRKPLLGRILVEIESPEEFFRLARMAGWARVLLHTKKQTLFVIDKSGYVYYVKVSGDSPWMSAKFAVVNELKEDVRPSNLPSTNAGDMNIAIIRITGISPARR